MVKVALGRSKEEEYQENLSLVAADLQGNTGLLFTSKPQKEVEEYFHGLSICDYARSGFQATECVVLPAGPLPQFVASMVDGLRKLGLPVQLRKGTIVLEQEYTICTKDQILTPEQAKLLVHFEHKMAAFTVTLRSHWSQGQYASYEADLM